MQYDMFKTIDTEKQKEGFNRHQTQFMATVMTFLNKFTYFHFRRYCVKSREDLTLHSSPF